MGLEILYRAFLLQISSLISEIVMSALDLSLGCMTFAFFSAQWHNFLCPKWSNNLVVSFEFSDKQWIFLSWLYVSIIPWRGGNHISALSPLIKERKITMPFPERMDASTLRRELHVLDLKWREIFACIPWRM